MPYWRQTSGLMIVYQINAHETFIKNSVFFWGSSIIQLSLWASLPMLSCWVQILYSFGGSTGDNSFVAFYPS